MLFGLWQQRELSLVGKLLVQTQGQ
jgi:hypothetical protein